MPTQRVRPAASRRRVLGGVAGVLAAAALAMLGAPGGEAQAQDIPSGPIIYQGEVYLDGALLEGEGQLIVRVGPWKSDPVVVQEGRFLNLLAAPPSFAYAGERISFHLRGMEAHQRFTFPLLAEPRSETVRLDFGELLEAPADPTPTATEAPEADNAETGSERPEGQSGAAASESSAQDDGGGVSAALIAGTVAGALALLVAVGFGWVRLARRRRA